MNWITNMDIDNKLQRIIDWLHAQECKDVSRPLLAAALFVQSHTDADIDGLKQVVRSYISDANLAAESLDVDNWQAANDMITLYRTAMFSRKKNANHHTLTHGKSVFHYMEAHRKD